VHNTKTMPLIDPGDRLPVRQQQEVAAHLCPV